VKKLTGDILFTCRRNFFRVTWYAPARPLFAVSFLILYILFSAGSLQALTPIVIDQNTESVSTGKYMEILEDPSGKLTIDDVTKPEMQNRWFRSKWDVPNFGKSRSAYWFRLNIINYSSGEKEYLIKEDWPLFDRIDVFFLKDSELISKYEYGNIYPFNRRDIFDNNFIFKVPLKIKDIEVLIRIQTETSNQMLLKIMSAKTYEIEARKDLIFYCIFFGIIIVMFFYNLVIFISLKDSNYLFYIMYLFAQIMFHLSYLNLGFQYIWPEHPEFNLHCMPFSLGIVGVTSLIFAKQFLNIDNRYYRLNIFFIIFILIFLSLSLWSIFNIFTPLKLINISGFIWTPSLIISSIYIYKNGYKPARFFLYSWIIMLIGTLVIIQKNLGIIPVNFFTSNSQIIGISIEVVLISFALADRINIMKSEKEEAQNEALRIQKEATETLEQKVSERTAELAAANEKLRDLDRAKTDFFANISHELRTPLTLILAPVEEALAGKPIERDSLELVHRSGSNLLSLINDLLEVSLVTSGRVTLEVAETDAGDLVRKCCAGMESAAKLKGITLACDTEDSLTVWVDSKKIAHVMSNMFSNSFKFTEPGGRIDVSCGVDGGYIIIRFSDTGCGIPEDKVPVIFERFVQADTGSTRGYEGTGIGLSLVKDIVELHRGTVSVESRYIEDYPGEHGSVFTVKIPSGRDHLAGRNDIKFISTESGQVRNDLQDTSMQYMTHVRGIDRPVQSTVPADKDKYQAERDLPAVLVVEDNSDMRNLVAGMLAGGYVVYTASGGREAIQVLESIVEIDLVLSDIMMPGMDGHQLLRWIRGDEKFSGIPFIFLTARADMFMKLEGLELGAVDYVTKPFNSDELLLRIRNQMEQKKLRNTIARNYKGMLVKLRNSVHGQPGTDSLANITDDHDPRNNRRMEQLCLFMNEHYTEEITRDDLAAALNINPDTFSRLFNQYTGTNLNDYISRLRIEEAKRRLSVTDDPVTRISLDTGYGSIRTFNRAFKKITGLSPQEYRNR